MIDLNQRPLSFSSLSQFDISPVHYIKYITQVKEQTPQMLLGSLVHCMILEPDEVDNEYVLAPKFDMRKKEDKEAKIKFEQDNEGKKVIDPETWETAKNIASAVYDSPMAVNILSKLDARECHFRFEHEGMPVNGYIDGIGKQNDTPFVLEIKTSVTANPTDVIKDFYNKKYHIQAGIYRTAIERMGLSDKCPVVYIVVENKAPHIVSMFMASDEYVSHGVKEFNRLVDEFKEWKSIGFPTVGYSKSGSEELYELSLPGWVK
jgi:exodeoxyribonuclease VIII